MHAFRVIDFYSLFSNVTSSVLKNTILRESGKKNTTQKQAICDGDQKGKRTTQYGLLLHFLPLIGYVIFISDKTEINVYR